MEKYEELLDKINNLNISNDEKENLKSIINDLNIDYNRLKKSTDMQIHVLEKEKELLLNNFIKKDNDANYLYGELEKIRNSKSWKLAEKLQKIKHKVVRK